MIIPQNISQIPQTLELPCRRFTAQGWEHIMIVFAVINTKAQYTLPTPTRRNCFVASRRVGGVYKNSQLAHDDCRRIRRCERSRWP